MLLTVCGLAFVGYNFVVPIARYSMLETGLTLHSATISLIASVLGYVIYYPETVSAFGVNCGSTCVVGVATLLALTLAIYNFATEIRGPNPKDMDLTGRVYIVTGANSGIGLETCRRLAQNGATVIMGCRSKQRASAAFDDVTKSIPSSSKGRVMLLDASLDLCSMKSVSQYCDAFLQLNLPLNGLICNAGMIPSSFELSPDGLESGFAANHLGHFVMCQKLLPLLAQSSQPDKKDLSRVVILSSSLHKLARAKDASRVATKDEFSSFPVYSRCKLANLLFMHGLIDNIASSSDLKGRVTVNALHPGNPCTNFTSNLNSFLRWGEALTLPLMYLVRETCYAGAFCSVFAATSPSLHNKNGLYLVDSTSYSPSNESFDK